MAAEQLSERIGDFLRCPECGGELHKRPEDSSGYACAGCGKSYPVKDGIPDFMDDAG